MKFATTRFPKMKNTQGEMVIETEREGAWWNWNPAVP